MADNCCGKGSEVMLLACSGGSNVGQLANQAAVEKALAEKGTPEVAAARSAPGPPTSDL